MLKRSRTQFEQYSMSFSAPTTSSALLLCSEAADNKENAMIVEETDDMSSFQLRKKPKLINPLQMSNNGPLAMKKTPLQPITLPRILELQQEEEIVDLSNMSPGTICAPNPFQTQLLLPTIACPSHFDCQTISPETVCIFFDIAYHLL